MTVGRCDTQRHSTRDQMMLNPTLTFSEWGLLYGVLALWHVSKSLKSGQGRGYSDITNRWWSRTLQADRLWCSGLPIRLMDRGPSFESSVELFIRPRIARELLRGGELFRQSLTLWAGRVDRNRVNDLLLNYDRRIGGCSPCKSKRVVLIVLSLPNLHCPPTPYLAAQWVISSGTCRSVDTVEIDHLPLVRTKSTRFRARVPPHRWPSFRVSGAERIFQNTDESPRPSKRASFKTLYSFLDDTSPATSQPPVVIHTMIIMIARRPFDHRIFWHGIACKRGDASCARELAESCKHN